MTSTSTTKSIGNIKMETITFADRTRRYRVYMPCVTGQSGISTDNLVMANKLFGMRECELAKLIRG